MINLKQLEVWFVTGSQHLYGEETLKQVAANSTVIADALNKAPNIPVQIVTIIVKWCIILNILCIIWH